MILDAQGIKLNSTLIEGTVRFCDSVTTWWPVPVKGKEKSHIEARRLLGVIDWFEDSRLCDSIDAGSSLELVLAILLLTCVVEILQLWICRNGPFTCSSRSQTARSTDVPTHLRGAVPGWLQVWSA